MEATELLYGTIRTVVYQNQDNGYAVLKLQSQDGELVTAVGTIPLPAPGEEVALAGSWTDHATYGRQFKGELVERLLPTTAQGILDYLSGGAVPGIGAKTAQKLVSLFGDKTLAVLERQPELLQSQAGLSLKRARALTDSYRRQISARQLVEFLKTYHFEPYLALRVYRCYGEEALDQIQFNPYLLTREEIGADFIAVDTMAAQMGLDAEDPQRMEAAVVYALEHNSTLGHVYVPRQKLLQSTAQMLHLDLEPVEKALDRLIEQGVIVQDQMRHVTGCYLRKLYEAECAIGEKLRYLVEKPRQTLPDFKKTLELIQRETGFQFAPQQQAAIRMAGEGHVLVLTGGPGTGKTTTLQGILALYDHMGLTTLLAAPTGRAAKRMEEVCGREASTIHRMLETQFDENTGKMVFFHDEGCPLKADAVIVDEASMLDTLLTAALVQALPLRCRLILVGDRDQLPSVGPGQILRGILKSGIIPSVTLTEIFRQAQTSLIVTNAHAVNRGELPVLNATDRDFFFLKRRSADEVADTICDLCARRLPDNMGIPAEQIQVLSPSKVGRVGTVRLNRQLQNALNPAAPDKQEISFGDYLFRRGDKVMQVRNNYDIIWTRDDGEQGYGIFNGDVGRIETLTAADRQLTVRYDDRVVEYTFDMLADLEPAYAVTVHKSQGSEYKAVILCVFQGPEMLLTRSVLYTAITRARDLLILVGDENIVAAMTSNVTPSSRFGAVSYRIAPRETEE